MDLIYMNPSKEDVGVLLHYDLDLAFGSDENSFACTINAADHCCEEGYFLYIEGTEYGGIVDSVQIDTERNEVTYFGRTWQGILGSKVVVPATEEDFTLQFYVITASVTGGTVNPASATVRKGKNQTFTFTPDIGYTVESVTVDGVAIDPETFTNTYTFENVTEEHTIDVVYVKTGILPNGYTRLEYIESTGTQYIDTGYRPTTENLKITTQFSLTEIQAWHALFGCEETNSGPWALTPLVNGASALTFYSGTSYQIGSIPVTANTVYDLTCQTDNGVLTYECGAATGTASASGSLCKTDSIYVFTLNSATESSVLGQASKMRVYSFQIYDNGVLVRDLIPCMNAADTLGLYDIVGGVFYPNLGSGTFTAGPEYIEEHAVAAAYRMEPYSVNDYTVTVKKEDADGNSLAGRYLVLSGDANDCIQFILDRIGLDVLFVASTNAESAVVSQYQFHRYTDAYTGLCKMLKSAGLKLNVEFADGMVVLSAVALYDYSQDEEFDSDSISFRLKKNYKTVNHLVCLGSGELENRMVVHLYVDADGNISQTQTLTDEDEYASVFDYPNAESEEELIKSGRDELKALWGQNELSVSFDPEEDIYGVGDIVGAYDNITKLSVSAEIIKKIVTIKNGRVTISYEVGEK